MSTWQVDWTYVSGCDGFPGWEVGDFRDYRNYFIEVGPDGIYTLTTRSLPEQQEMAKLLLKEDLC